MRAAGYPEHPAPEPARADLIACQRCQSKAPSVTALASHLVTDHMMSGTRAIAEAHEAAGMEPAAGEWGPPRTQGEQTVRPTNETERPTRGTVPEETDNFPASIWGPLTCPRCPNEYPRRVLLAQHLINIHGLTSTVALRTAQGVEKDQQREAERQEHADAVPSAEAEPIEPPTPKETRMAEPICTACEKPFVRTGKNQKVCKSCNESRCNACGRIGEHGPKCRRRGKTAGTTKKARRGTRRSKKPKPAAVRAVREVAATNGGGELKDSGGRAAAKTLLEHLYRVRDNLVGRIKNVEELATLL